MFRAGVVRAGLLAVTVAATAMPVITRAGVAPTLTAGLPSPGLGPLVTATAVTVIDRAGAPPARMTRAGVAAAGVRITAAAFTLPAPLRRGRRLYAAGEQAG